MTDEELVQLENMNIEVSFRLADDMPWMRVDMTVLKYKDCLEGIPFEGLTLRHILVNTFEGELQSEEIGTVHVIYDTFEHKWIFEYA